VIPERTDASCDANIFPARGFTRDSRRGFVDFSNAILKSEPRQANRVRTKRVRLDHAR